MPEVRLAVSEEIDRYLESLVRTGPFANKAELVRAALVSFAGQAVPMAQGFDTETRLAPDGRVYQLEYAREAVRRGSASVGIVFDGGIVLAASTPSTKLVRPGMKIRRIQERLALLSSGLVADAHMAATKLEEAKPKTTKEVLDLLVRFFWDHTVDRMKRPLGVGLLIASALDGQGRLFYLDPSAALVEHDAVAIGESSDTMMEILEKKYRKGGAKEAERLALEALGRPEHFEIVKVT